MWRSTGEDLPDFLKDVATTADADPSGSSTPLGAPSVGASGPGDEAMDDDAVHDAPALPKLNAHAANPVLDVLKKIDHHKAAIQYVEQAIRCHHQTTLTQGVQQYLTPADVRNDFSTTPAQLRERAENALRLVALRNVCGGTSRSLGLESCNDAFFC
jgi:hypothetical protein